MTAEQKLSQLKADVDAMLSMATSSSDYARGCRDTLMQVQQSLKEGDAQ